MNYRLVPYALKLTKLRSLIGCQQENLPIQVCQQFLLAEHAKHPIGVDAHADLFDALDDLVGGGNLDPERGCHYGYALQAICQYIGNRLDSKHWNHVKWAVLEDTGLNAVMGKGSPIDLPLIPDFPTIGHLSNRKIRRRIEEPRGNSLKIESENVHGLLRDFDGWVEQAYEARQDLVFFYY
ncbi:MAG: hypothetical protein MK108_01755 [Mariniblastus sp.]|nr:hypothetical protein [Mariniblastus sp.]